ncbi:MAG: serine hydrolase [Patescibacteria group bacterium]
MLSKTFGLKTAFFSLVLVFLALPACAAEPKLKAGALRYERSDREFVAAVVLDEASGETLYSYQANKVWPAASLSKLMSALVTVDHHQPWTSIYATKRADEVGGGSLVVPVGSTMSVKDMFFSSIVGSANNTTMSLARLSGLGTAGFVKHMNATAKQMGLKHTSFVEPTGLSEKNVTCAADMAKIVQAAFSNKTIQTAASTRVYNFNIRNRSLKKSVKNTNRLLTTDSGVNVLGGKTGYIVEADYNFVLKAADSVGGRRIIVVVLGAPTKEGSFNAGRSLANWAWRAYSWQSGSVLATSAK